MIDNAAEPIDYYIILVPHDTINCLVEYERTFNFADVEAIIQRAIDNGHYLPHISVAWHSQEGNSPSDEDECLGSYSGESFFIDESQDDSARWG